MSLAGFRETLKSDSKILQSKHCLRVLQTIEGRESRSLILRGKKYLDFSSNDYLGLSNHPQIKKKAAAGVIRWGCGSGASRLISGNLRVHEILEEKIAKFKGEESSLVFSSGYLANLGAVTALADERDIILLDRNNHASLVDAARLSRAKIWVYSHTDMDALRKLLLRLAQQGYRRRLVLTDAYFSMDGDIAPLCDLVSLCEKSDAILMVDEAHSTGVFGKSGRGLTEHFSLQGKIHVVMGTLSKALGSVGGYIAGCRELRDALVNGAKTFVYTTGPAPASSSAAIAALEWIEKHPEAIRSFQQRVGLFRKKLEESGFDLMGSTGPIFPIKIGESGLVLKWREALKSEGIYVAAVRPPTVPKKTDRLRLSLKATHTQADFERLLRALNRVKGLSL